MSKRSKGSDKRVALALQGGGSHGAFTWGVLDRLLQEPGLEIEAISGTSAGALNAAVLAHGLTVGGREGARQALHDFWKRISEIGGMAFHPHLSPPDWLYSVASSMVSIWMEMLSLVWSPYDNPFYRNLLADVIENAVDFARLKSCSKPRLFICATNVLTNERRVFSSEELGAEVLLASACLPLYFRTVEIDGSAYWDGGYMGNPVLSPLTAFCQDIVIVQVNPFRRDRIPVTARDIIGRLNEITFDASLIHEINTIDTLTKLIRSGSLRDSRYKPINFHFIADERALGELGADSKSDTSWTFLSHLHRLGRSAADGWLKDEQRYGKVGVESSCDVDWTFIRPLHNSRGQGMARETMREGKPGGRQGTNQAGTVPIPDRRRAGGE